MKRTSRIVLRRVIMLHMDWRRNCLGMNPGMSGLLRCRRRSEVEGRIYPFRNLSAGGDDRGVRLFKRAPTEEANEKVA